jgi:hypothetical protein
MPSSVVIDLLTKWGIQDDFSIFPEEGYVPQVAATKIYHEKSWVSGGSGGSV